MDLVRESEASTGRAIEKLVSLLVDESRLSRGVDRSEVESLKAELESIRVFLSDVDARSQELRESFADAWPGEELRDVFLIRDADAWSVEVNLSKVSLRDADVWSDQEIESSEVSPRGAEARSEDEVSPRDADARSEEVKSSDAVKVWLKEAKEVAELIEDVVDEYILEDAQRQHQRRFVGFLGGAGRLIGTLNNGRKLSSNIQNIKALLREVQERGQRYRDSVISDRVFHNRTADLSGYRFRLNFPYSRSTVAIDSAASELIQRLVEGACGLSVISLVGIGGIGKTTLANEVCCNEVVRGYFDCLVWITVTQSYSLEYLLRMMVFQIVAAVKHDVQDIGVVDMRREELIDTLRRYLQTKRYLLVFDDVWHEQFWEEVRLALPDNEAGSRVIITTRSDNVTASFERTSRTHVHRLEPLSQAISWELFCTRAFRNDHQRRCPPRLEQLSHEIIRMCQGLPLAIVAIAGLLSTKEKTVVEWKRLLYNFPFQLKLDPHLSTVSKILALSFHDLPHYLKLCFLYFSIFAEDTLILNEKLIKLWIAEGFIKEKNGMTLEEVAEEYLNELIQRNLVQACEQFYGLEKFCRLHGLMHEIARQEADELSFVQIMDGKNSSFRGKTRRLSIYDNIEENVLETIGNCQVRSVFLCKLGSLDNSFVLRLFRKYKLLTLLDFENVQLDCLPEEVGNLFHLKYLSLKNTKVKRLPKSVGKLWNLQTLDLRQTLLVELPIEINMLRNLRHLLASGCFSNISLDLKQGVRIKEGFGDLESLQTLMTVKASLGSIDLGNELHKLRRLRRLGLSRLTAEVVSAICPSIEKMNHLEYLSLHSMTSYEILDLQTISSPPPLLQHLVLRGLLRRFPNWISHLANLNMLCLSVSRLTDDPLGHISDLPNLVSLWFYRAYEGKQLHFEVGGFQKLKLLVLRDLQGLEVVEIEEGALPLLEELRIGPSPLLNEVPSGIQHLRNLKVLAFYDMPNELVRSMQRDGGSDYVKIEHVPSVLFWYRVQGRSYALYELGDSVLLDRLQGLATDSLNDIVRQDLRLSLCYSDEEANSVSASTSYAPWACDQMSFSSDRFSFFTDDIED